MAKIRERGKGETVVRMNQQLMEDKMIQDVLDNFNFQKCWVAMKALGWTWGFDSIQPSIEELRSSGEQRLRNAMKYCRESKGTHNSPYWVSTGGLKATAWKNRYGHIEGVRLEFVLTDWDSDGDY